MPNFTARKSKGSVKDDGSDGFQKKKFGENVKRSQSFESMTSPTTANSSEVNLENFELTEDNSKTYNLIKLLNQGKFSKVVLMKSNKNDKYYSIKILDKNKVKEDHKLATLFNNERKILMETINCKFAINMKEIFESGDSIWMVSEFPSDKNLAFFIKKNKKLSHKFVMFYATEIFLGIKYLHIKNIIYRNLNLENIVITLSGHIKLADFGFAKELTRNEPKAITFCGSPAFMAPEMILTKPYTYSVDWWAYGVVVYVMITGNLPFSKKTDSETLKSILTDLPIFNSKLGPLTEEFLSHLLDKDPYFRLGCYCSNGYDEVETHKFFNQIDWIQVENHLSEVHYLPYENSPQEFELAIKEQKNNKKGSFVENT